MIDAALAPISSLTDILSGETYATVSAVFPILHLLNNTLLKESEDDTLLTKNLKSRIKVDFNERYTEMRLGDDVFSILQVSTVLDPRFKMKYVSEDVILDLKEEIATKCLSVLASSQDSTVPSSSKQPNPPPPPKTTNLTQKNLILKKIWWKLNASKYPNLKKLAQKYFTVVLLVLSLSVFSVPLDGL